jgi:hypothetical protein
VVIDTVCLSSSYQSIQMQYFCVLTYAFMESNFVYLEKSIEEWIIVIKLGVLLNEVKITIMLLY